LSFDAALDIGARAVANRINDHIFAFDDGLQRIFFDDLAAGVIDAVSKQNYRFASFDVGEPFPDGGVDGFINLGVFARLNIGNGAAQLLAIAGEFREDAHAVIEFDEQDFILRAQVIDEGERGSLDLLQLIGGRAARIKQQGNIERFFSGAEVFDGLPRAVFINTKIVFAQVGQVATAFLFNDDRHLHE